MIQRVLAVLHARNLEFLRDRATLGWNVLVPIALVGALALIFSGPERPLFKVGVMHAGPSIETSMHPFLATRRTSSARRMRFTKSPATRSTCCSTCAPRPATG